MKIQIKKQNRVAKKTTMDKTKALRWVIIGFGIAIVALWISWFTCDCIFVSKGIDVNVEGIEYGAEIPWSWNNALFKAQEIQCIIMLGLVGVYMCLLLSYMVVCGLNLKKHLKLNLYQLLASTAAFIALTICVIKAAQMMIEQKYVLDIKVVLSILNPEFTFNVYHTDFLNWVSILPGATIFSLIIVLCSFRKFDRDVLIRDCNLLILVLGAMVALLFIPFVIAFGFSDPIAEGLEIVTGPITWRHIVAQCITCPISVFAGMTMVLMVVRLICVIFAYNERWSEKKIHIIIFCVVTFLVFAAFIVAHVFKQDFEKLIFDYNSMKVGALLVVLAEAVTCLGASTYCLVSHVRYQKRVI